MSQLIETSGPKEIPNWVPRAARLYLAHTEEGCSIRQLARDIGCHASTVLRQVRRIENRRDDPLVDAALKRLGVSHPSGPGVQTDAKHVPKDERCMTKAEDFTASPDEATLAREARRILKRLCESGAVLAVAAEMDKAVVVRDTGDGGSTRSAVVDSTIAQAMALKDWIACDAPGRISRYRITSIGRSTLNRLVAEQENRVRGFAEAQAGFDTGREAEAALNAIEADPRARRGRFLLAESPLIALARRKDKSGDAFLNEELVAAGERLREDFELAQIGPRAAQNWDTFLTDGILGGTEGDAVKGGADARARLEAALRDLGPGLGDVALRCCCYLEGLEMTEKELGWSARSGKIVLRIALQRLRHHYAQRAAQGGDLVG
ncbi:DUF6456 domain-containing protein [Thalassococcus lentus]|uniref:DUF6456 domain-containing protein n=1 Tax=Thalassococcus lentus TaxID=1210524 RepID=A0ABT4XRI2_9RHOB|nr:DUF6456 domain-containing protein [Thalassococcus lentus]MDA7424546.1 DUF6456 domain-containing protein [Thalassococcus lentus]